MLKKLIGFLVLFSFGICFAQTKVKSDRFLKRVAFNQVDHFFIGGHVGMNLTFYSYDAVVNHRISFSESSLASDLILYPSLPTFRIFSGYKFKRHSFELGIETLQYHYYSGGGIYYLNCPFPSISYNIDLSYKKPISSHLLVHKLEQ